MTAAPPRRFDDPAPPSPLAAAASLMRARWDVCLAFVVASAIATTAAAAVVLAGVIASAALEAAIAATPIAAVVAADATTADTAAVGTAIRALPGVASATLRSKDDALHALTAAGTPVPDGRNPLPDVWIVVLNAAPIIRGAQTVTQSATALRAALARLPNVEAVRIDDRWLARLADRTEAWKLAWPVVQGGILLAIAIAVVCCSVLAGRALYAGEDVQRLLRSKWVLAIVAIFVTVMANSLALAAVYMAVAAGWTEAVIPIDTWLDHGGGMLALTAAALASLLLTVFGMTLSGLRDRVN